MVEDDGNSEYEGTREEMERAIRRLNALEYVIFAAVFILALAGGAFVAWILSTGTALPFRLTWGVISVLLILLPGLLVFGREHFKRRGEAEVSEAPGANNG